MSTMSKAIASNTTNDMNAYSNTRYILEDPTQEEPIPTWARALIEKVEATNVNFQATNVNFQALIVSVQSFTIKLDQMDNSLKNLESQDESDFWEDNSPQIEIPKEPINDHLDSSNVVPSNDYYPKDRIDYQYNEVRVDIPMIKEVDDPKENFNMDMTRSLAKTTQFTNPTPKTNSTISCFKCRKVGHVKTNCPKLAIVMDDSNPLHTNDSNEFELEDENYELYKAISIKHVHIIHDIVLKQFASSYERYKPLLLFLEDIKFLNQVI